MTTLCVKQLIDPVGMPMFGASDDIPTPEWMKKPNMGSNTHPEAIGVGSVDWVHLDVRKSVHALTKFMLLVLADSLLATKYRHDPGHQTNDVLRVIKAVVEFVSLGVHPRDLPETSTQEFQSLYHYQPTIVIDLMCSGETNSGSDPLVSAWGHLGRIETIADNDQPRYMRCLSETGQLFGIGNSGRHHRLIILWMIVIAGDWLTDYSGETSLGAGPRNGMRDLLIVRTGIPRSLYESLGCGLEVGTLIRV